MMILKWKMLPDLYFPRLFSWCMSNKMIMIITLNISEVFLYCDYGASVLHNVSCKEVRKRAPLNLLYEGVSLSAWVIRRVLFISDNKITQEHQLSACWKFTLWSFHIEWMGHRVKSTELSLHWRARFVVTFFACGQIFRKQRSEEKSCC